MAKKETKERINRLSLKEKDFSKKFVESKGNGTEAAFESYNVKNRNTAAVIANHNLNKPKIIQEIETLMEDKEITGSLMMDRLKEGLGAKIVTEYRGEAQETKIPDISLRHKYLDTALKIASFYPAQQVESRSFNIDLQLEAMSKEDLVALFQDEIKKISDEFRNKKFVSSEQTREEKDSGKTQGKS